MGLNVKARTCHRILVEETHFYLYSEDMRERGLSMIEVLVVVAILAILFAVGASMLWDQQLAKARDAQRKDDLSSIKVAFEEYYNDNGCYPPPSVLNNPTVCDTDALAPYISSYPCDPDNGQPYAYIPVPGGGDDCATQTNAGYRVLSRLEQQDDVIVEQLGCVGGCPLTDEQANALGLDDTERMEYLYGVSEGVSVGEVVGDLENTRYYCATATDTCQQCAGTGDGQCPGPHSGDSYGDYATEASCQANCPPS